MNCKLFPPENPDKHNFGTTQDFYNSQNALCGLLETHLPWVKNPWINLKQSFLKQTELAWAPPRCRFIWSRMGGGGLPAPSIHKFKKLPDNFYYEDRV